MRFWGWMAELEERARAGEGSGMSRARGGSTRTGSERVGSSRREEQHAFTNPRVRRRDWETAAVALRIQPLFQHRAIKAWH
jgi:hypothetical protein